MEICVCVPSYFWLRSRVRLYKVRTHHVYSRYNYSIAHIVATRIHCKNIVYLAYFPCVLYIFAELRLPPKAITTTTPTPYIYTTQKPRRKQHQSHNHKGGHDTSSRAKEILLPNLQENEIVGAAGSPLEGM